MVLNVPSSGPGGDPGAPGGHWADRRGGAPGVVRQDILTSWQRCLAAGLRPDRFEVPYQPDMDDDGPLRWVEIGAYYIVSEALANTAKHANTGLVEVFAEAGRRVLSLTVRDDGVGGADPHGSGLAGLRERAGALGGMLQLTSPPGRGTSLHVRLPAVAR